ncbi:PKD domain-containing protein [Agrococcus sp. SCSIO52902]|uniref:PKD domain-containing protein n=1 Tax=Agrococcus sp. SCSIO52902 TaxID=2933290 RepID=UPI001FF56866|nr:PKD domain-containing protein [Agrococcus sp. SCSIO52902]UOW00822.1 PKD domain-containing protein [Agrococcus sp. SCSIO52902]UOW00884.1 PKD domain-containing protein [Agrococcus sp. SCSIO52902]
MARRPLARTTSVGCAVIAAMVLSLTVPIAASAAPPAAPLLVAPADGSTTASVSPTLSVAASDPDGGSVDVAFEGRERGATVPSDPAAEGFTVVVVPDTQNYSDGKQALLQQQLTWVRDSRDALDTAFVIQLGDLVNDWTLERGWDNISDAFSILDDGAVPNSVVPGNHDFDIATGDMGPYNAHFPPSRYAEGSWSTETTRYGGYLGQDQFGPDPIDRGNADNYALFTAGGVDFLVLNLEWEAPGYALDWADRVLDAHPDRTVIMATHSFLSITGTHRTTPQRPGGTAPAAMWQDFVAQHCQIRLVLSGHEHDGDLGEASRTDENVCGLPVHQILTDYQARANGGNGWLRYYSFEPTEGTLTATTYSPVLGQYETDADSSFTLPFDLTSREPAPFEPIGTVRVDAGEVASVDWPDLALGTEYEWRAVVSDGASTTTSSTWTLRTPAANAPPTASIAVESDGLTVTASASGSTDADGTIASYAWQLGDGSTASGETASHTYAGTGVYPITLTVTDDEGASGEAVRSVTVLDPAERVLALDDFGRTVANAWGSADVGGAWTLRGPSSRFSVSGGAGRMTVPASMSQTVYADLNGVSSASTRIDAVFSVGSRVEAQYVSLVGRRIGSANYIARLRLQADGGVRLYLLQDGATAIAPMLQVPITIAPGQQYAFSMEVTGTSPTTVRAKLWPVGQAEPGWMRSGTNSLAALQAPGAVSVFTYVPNNPGGGSVAFDRITVTDPAGAAPSPNAAPTASFSVAASGLTVTANGAGSSDSDGSIAAYEWDFGAGFAAGGSTASHVYPAAGEHTVRLRVTDDDGATAVAERSVTVVAPATDVLADDAFDRTVSNAWGSADVGGAWTLRGTASRFSVSGGAGRMTIPPATTQTVFADLNGVSSTSTRIDAVFSVGSLVEAQYVSLVGRRIGSANYIARLRLQADGGVRLYLLQDGATAIAPMLQVPITIVPGQQYAFSMEVTGTSPTTVRAKLWPVGQAEPGWMRSGTNSLAALQGPGAVSVFTYVPNNPGGGSVAFDRITVTEP